MEQVVVLKDTEVVTLRDMQEIYLEARREQERALSDTEQELLALDYAYEQWLDTLDAQEEHCYGC